MAEDTKAGASSNPLTVVGIVAGIGFVCFMFILRLMTRADVPPNIFVPITLVYFATLLGICFMLLRHGASLARNSREAEQNINREPEFLQPATTAQLEEAREFGIGSVTDATTRTLDKVRVRDDRGQ